MPKKKRNPCPESMASSPKTEVCLAVICSRRQMCHQRAPDQDFTHPAREKKLCSATFKVLPCGAADGQCFFLHLSLLLAANTLSARKQIATYSTTKACND